MDIIFKGREIRGSSESPFFTFFDRQLLIIDLVRNVQKHIDILSRKNKYLSDIEIRYNWKFVSRINFYVYVAFVRKQ